MSEQVADLPRKFYHGPGGQPFLFYVVFAAFSQMPALSRQEYRSNGVFPGLKFSHYDRDTGNVHHVERLAHNDGWVRIRIWPVGKGPG